MKKLILTSIGLLILIIALNLPALAGEIEPKFAAYLSTLPDGDFVSAIIYLQDRPDIKALDQTLRQEKALMKVRHERVLTVLKQTAERSQPALLNYLSAKKESGTVKGYTPYWITNLVVVYATKAELEKIAQRGDVEAIEGNFRVTLIEPVYMGPPIAGIGVTNSLKAINADRVWKELGITGAGRLVANLDTGVDGVHPALTSRWRGNSHPWQECWRDALGYGTTSPVDYNGHGTHTMGTMCGAGHSTGDTVGVAFDALWIADNAIDQSVSPAFDNDVLDAFQWFADPDGNPNTTDDVPDVVQNSWGIDARFGYDYQDCDYRWQTAIENCEAAGVVVTFSAGNEGPSPQTHRSPANICKTPTTNFSVGAVDCENYGWPYPIASFSSRGPSDCDGVTIKPEVVGPGVYVYSSYPGGSYARMSGTSMAGPHVAGVVALMRQANPNADVQTIKTVLMSTARDLGTAGEENTYGWGIIDAYEAVLSVLSCDVSADFSGTPLSGCYPLTVQFTDLSTGPVISWDWNFGDGTPHSSLQNPSHTYQNAGTYTVSLKVTSDSCTNTETKINYVTVLTAPVANFQGSPTTGASPLTVNFTDLSTNSPTSWDWNFGDGTTHSYVKNPSHIYNNPGDYTVTLIASNSCGSDSEIKTNYIHVTSGPYIYSSSIVVTRAYEKRTNSYYGKAVITVLDEYGAKVRGAEVSAHWSGLTSDYDMGITNVKGQVTFNSDKRTVPHCGYFVENVDNIVKSGYWFNSGIGETHDSVYSCVSAKEFAEMPEEFDISQNYPNPFNLTTNISFYLPNQSQVDLTIYNLLGEKVKTLANGVFEPGSHSVSWDGKNESGSVVASGIYFYRLNTGENVITKRMTLLK